MHKEQLPSMAEENGDDKVALLITSIEGYAEPEMAEAEEGDCSYEEKMPSSIDEAVEHAGRNAKSSSDFVRILKKLGYSIEPNATGKVVNRKERMTAYQRAKSKVQE